MRLERRPREPRDLWPEWGCAVAVAEENGDGVAGLVGDGEIEIAVAIEVRGNRVDRVGSGAKLEIRSGGEGAVTLAEKNLNQVRSSAGDGEIDVPVIIAEIAGDEGRGLEAIWQSDVRGRLERRHRCLEEWKWCCRP